MMRNYTRIDCKSRNEWLEQRTKGIGATDIAAILGISPWTDGYQLWEQKKNPTAEAFDVDNPAVRAGRLLEDAVAKWFTLSTGQRVYKNSAGDWIARSREADIFICSPDRLYRTKDGEIGLLECKTCRKGFDPENLPPHYVAQVQWQMAVTGIRRATLAWLASGIDFGCAEIDYDEEYADKMKSAALDWWARYMDGTEIPEPQRADTVKLRYPQPAANASVASEDEITAWRTLKEINSEIKRLDEEKKRLTDVLCAAIGPNDSLVISDECGGVETLATYKAQQSTRLDTARLKKERPDIAAEYTAKTSTRVLRVKE